MMAQVNLYLDEILLERVRSVAREENLSLSGYVRRLLISAVDDQSRWPVDYEKLLGSIEEDELSCPTRTVVEVDAPRESL